MANEPTKTTMEPSTALENTQNETNLENNIPTVDELLAQLATANAEKERYKNANDKLSKSEAEMKRQLKAKLTAEELAAEARKEMEEQQRQYIAELEGFKRMAEAKARYALQGMSTDLAEEAAQAEVDGDMDRLASVQRKHTEALIKAKEIEWHKLRPQTNIGSGGDGMLSHEQFERMSIAEKSKLYRENRTEYDRLKS